MNRLTIRDPFSGMVDFAKPYYEPVAPIDEVTEALEKLAAYEDTGLEPNLCADYAKAVKEGRYIILKEREGAGVARLREIAAADVEGRLVVLPFVAMIEQSLQDGKMVPQRDQKFNGRYAVVYSDKTKSNGPLIDICGGHYDRSQAEERLRILNGEEAEAALRKEQGDDQP